MNTYINKIIEDAYQFDCANPDVSDYISLSVLDRAFNQLVQEGYIYDEDAEGHGMSMGEYIAVSEYLIECMMDVVDSVTTNPLERATAVYSILRRSSDDALMWSGVDVDSLYFNFDEWTGKCDADGFMVQFYADLCAWIRTEYIPYLYDDDSEVA